MIFNATKTEINAIAFTQMLAATGAARFLSNKNDLNGFL